MPSDLDIEQADQLVEYLRAERRIDFDESPVIRILRGGVSNRTVLVERANGQAWVLKQALAKLRVDVDWFSDPIRIHREALGLKYLEQLAPPGTITPLVFEDHEHHLLAMQAVPQPHENFKTLLLAGRVEMDHIEQFGRLLGTIHRGSGVRAAELAPLFDDRTFFESLRVEPYYRYSAEQVPESAEFFGRLIEDTYARRLTLVHGDYSPKNILVHDGRLILLDHEVIHFGDPAFDLGFSFAHLLSKAHHLPEHRARFVVAIRLYWQTYWNEVRDEKWAVDLEWQAVRHTLGCTLARVAGRSKLEYLSTDERARQRENVFGGIQNVPCTIDELAYGFVQYLQS